MLLAKKIKLEVSEQDVATLEFMQGKCRGLYNWWVMRLRNGERWPGVYAAKKTLKASRKYDPELNGVYNKLLQAVYFRLDKAMEAFFRRLKAGEKPGFPRVKPRHAFFTLCYEDCGLKMDRDENSARNILKRFLVGLRPHTDDSVRCAGVLTATEYV